MVRRGRWGDRTSSRWRGRRLRGGRTCGGCGRVRRRIPGLAGSLGLGLVRGCGRGSGWCRRGLGWRSRGRGAWRGAWAPPVVGARLPAPAAVSVRGRAMRGTCGARWSVPRPVLGPGRGTLWLAWGVGTPEMRGAWGAAGSWSARPGTGAPRGSHLGDHAGGGALDPSVRCSRPTRGYLGSALPRPSNGVT